ncbi:RsmB/NOP family class I SAM-dependent RNA methyltransferase [Solitalea sp. MAHUQ-68]|uniref:RsmB/NOP family class I SAM-dependent RNA methyltransferase n=1 Tax=Solitalea agri TaxID=2953739 RepID=A0A9X2F493_9SPHI|nr:RsmB/NOP family class I SAM-dependent RNA methyltransferase [Solitalea agri]MCO4293955.1 RsmB/NOP family class I SAM-dependent RNA methyltransferase [Solitalea agri]
MRFDNQLRIAASIIEEYNFEMPLSRFLANYFRKNKQMGSKDRKMASDLVYSFFRLGKSLQKQSVEECLLVAQFLCRSSFSPLLDQLQPVFNQQIELPLDEKFTYLKTLYPAFNPSLLFPFSNELSDGVDKEAFVLSQLNQPKLFIRVRKGENERVKLKLREFEIPFEELSSTCFAFKNTTKLDHLFEGDIPRPFEIQDYSSQLTGAYFKPAQWEQWWDCCAASGGKSLMLYEQEPGIKLLVSDIRESILDNLDERFKAAGIKGYHRKELDLTKNLEPFLPGREFDGIILDAPCSGSGTWGRTPEMVSNFEEGKIDWFSSLQKRIAANIVKWLKPGKPLIYITCSAFKKENEEVVQFISSELGFEIERSQLLKGYENFADTMFVARLIKK